MEPPRPPFTSNLVKTGDALEDSITKEERMSEPLCAVVKRYNIPPDIL